MSHSRLEKTLRFTERMVEMVEELKEARGYATFSSVVYTAIAELHSKTFPAYRKMGTTVKSPEEKERDLVGRKRAKEQIRIEEREAVCKLLDGKIADEGGTKVCVFYNYINKKRYLQKVALAQLSEDLIKTQYQPSKEKVERLQKEKKTDY